MVTQLQEPTETEVIYPESDGKPMADNTKQFRCIVTIQGGVDALFAERPDVFVAGDLLWYAIEGQPAACTAPDTMVVFGRPKGDRGSYKQWEEDNIAPQVVFEVMSSGNSIKEMAKKFEFYDLHGVEEYYLYDPDRVQINGWLRSADRLRVIEEMQGWVSPRLGVRFELVNGDLALYCPDGQRFATYVELVQQRDLERQEREQAQAQAAQERQEREQAQARADRLAARLRELGLEPEE